MVCDQCAHEIAPTNPPQAFSASQLITHVKMYLIGMKYKVNGLQDLAAAKFTCACEMFYIMQQFERVAEEIVMREGEGGKELRTIIIDTVAKHRELLGIARICEILKNQKGFVFEVLLKGGV